MANDLPELNESSSSNDEVFSDGGGGILNVSSECVGDLCSGTLKPDKDVFAEYWLLHRALPLTELVLDGELERASSTGDMPSF